MCCICGGAGTRVIEPGAAITEPSTPSRDAEIRRFQSLIIRVHGEATRALAVPRPIARVETENCNEILPNLYLGNAIAFLNTTHIEDIPLNFSVVTTRVGTEVVFPWDRPEPVVRVITDNPMGFRQVITACSVHRINTALLTTPTLTISRILNNYAERGISWHYIGEYMRDARSDSSEEQRRLYWNTIVHDSSIGATSPLRRAPRYGYGETHEKLERLMRKKQAEIETSHVRAWFAPTFAKLDRAVFEGVKTLVHCLEGKSRSATILAAYLINRFGVSTDQALTFLQARRICASPKFVADLLRYEALLRSSAEG